MQSYDNNGMVGGFGSFFTSIKDKIYQLAEGLYELANDDKDNLRNYFLALAGDIQYKWEEVVKAHELLIKNRESFGIPKFDNPAVIQTAMKEDPTIVGWTEDDEKYLGSLYSMVDKVIKYAVEVKNGQRGLAWDKDSKDAVVLGTADEPAIYVDAKGDFQLVNWESKGGSDQSTQIIPVSYLSGSGTIGTNPVTIGVIVLIGILLIGAGFNLWKYLGYEETKIKLASEKDIREHEDKVAQDLIAHGVPAKDAYNQANALNLETAKAIALMNESRSKPAPELETFKTIAWAALGITAVGGAVYAMYKFTGGSDKETVREVIRSEPALAAAEKTGKGFSIGNRVRIKSDYNADYGRFLGKTGTIVFKQMKYKSQSRYLVSFGDDGNTISVFEEDLSIVSV